LRVSHFTNGLLIANLLIVSSACPAANADSVSSTTVRLYSDVHLSTKALVQAQQEAVRIFRQAGIETVWVQCKPSPSPADRRSEQVRAVGRGRLFFTPEQARLMQYRLSTAKTRTADNAVKAGLAVVTGI